MSKGIQTHNTILNKAIFIASKSGLEALTIGKLANSVGISKSGLFAHFNSKEQLQLDLLKAVARKFNKIVIKPLIKIQSGESKLRELAKNTFKWSNADFMPGG